MALATPEVPPFDAVATAAGAQQAPPQDTVVTLPSSPPIPPTAASPTPPTVLDRAAAELDHLQRDLLSADPRLVAGCLELASGWIRSDASIRAALVQASTASDEEKQAVLGAKDARDAALGEVASVQVAARRWRASCRACRTSLPRRSSFAKRKRKT